MSSDKYEMEEYIDPIPQQETQLNFLDWVTQFQTLFLAHVIEKDKTFDWNNPVIKATIENKIFYLCIIVYIFLRSHFGAYITKDFDNFMKNPEKLFENIHTGVFEKYGFDILLPNYMKWMYQVDLPQPYDIKKILFNFPLHYDFVLLAIATFDDFYQTINKIPEKDNLIVVNDFQDFIALFTVFSRPALPFTHFYNQSYPQNSVSKNLLVQQYSNSRPNTIGSVNQFFVDPDIQNVPDESLNLHEFYQRLSVEITDSSNGKYTRSIFDIIQIDKCPFLPYLLPPILYYPTNVGVPLADVFDAHKNKIQILPALIQGLSKTFVDQNRCTASNGLSESFQSHIICDNNGIHLYTEVHFAGNSKLSNPIFFTEPYPPASEQLFSLE